MVCYPGLKPWATICIAITELAAACYKLATAMRCFVLAQSKLSSVANTMRDNCFGTQQFNIF